MPGVKRERADAVDRFAVAEAEELQAEHIEADEKFFDLHAAHFGHGKVAQLVDEDHETQHKRDFKSRDP